jgi:hypothetical protein
MFNYVGSIGRHLKYEGMKGIERKEGRKAKSFDLINPLGKGKTTTTLPK